MHPNDLCEHGIVRSFCHNGCLEKLAKKQEEEIDRIRLALNERHQLLSNLTAAQQRCNELLEENRRLNRELATQDATVTALLQTVDQLEQELAAADVQLSALKSDG